MQNHKSSKTESIGNLIIPQLNYHLKENTVDSITAKKLTQQQIALAPSVSYEWVCDCISFISAAIVGWLMFGLLFTDFGEAVAPRMRISALKRDWCCRDCHICWPFISQRKLLSVFVSPISTGKRGSWPKCTKRQTRRRSLIQSPRNGSSTWNKWAAWIALQWCESDWISIRRDWPEFLINSLSDSQCVLGQ